jgi:diaminohydroxyphosphoribosylaminopyrimidine deaminase/5-amino-6-(5-phosphoribosylamino)uracil reductase
MVWVVAVMTIMNDEAYMRLALQMAEQALGQTGVNPVVGCVIVKNGRMIGIGTHLQAGTPHAEIHALQMAGSEAEGSTVYVTLEPCSHFGRTPPCADRLIAEKVKKVIIACKDPNKEVSGAGIERLRQHGIEVEFGLLEQEAIQLNEKFNTFIVRQTPFVTLKTASTLDGKIASRTGDSKWITNEASRNAVHTLRHQHQAIMVGVGTVIADNPKLSTRLSVPALHPIRIIVDSRLRTPMDAQVIEDICEGSQKTLILTTEHASSERQKEYEQHGVEVLRCGERAAVDLSKAMKIMGERGIGSILLEGGGQLNGAMLEAQLVDKMILFFAPKIIGGAGQAPSNFMFSGFEKMSDALELEQVKVEQWGDNVCVSGYPRYRGEGK